MNPLQLLVLFLGRVCLSVIFILSALNKIWDWQGYQMLVTNAFSDMHQIPQMNFALDFASAHLTLVLLIGIITELVGGVFVFLGIKARLGALLLILFLIPTTVIFHHFWLLDGSEKDLQTIMFLKNVSIIGGLLILLAFGSGKSVKSKPVPKE